MNSLILRFGSTAGGRSGALRAIAPIGLAAAFVSVVFETVPATRGGPD